MHILHIETEKDVGKVNNVDKFIKEGKNVFILIYMEGCGPCNATRPEWGKIENALKYQHSKNNKLVIVDINKDFIGSIKNAVGSVDGFPTIKYIGNYGKKVESYEDSSISKKDRTVDCFINWIESKINNVMSSAPVTSPYDVYNRISQNENGNSQSNKNNRKRKRTRHNSRNKKGRKSRRKIIKRSKSRRT